MRSKDKNNKQKMYHLNLLAKNINGVRNLNKLITEANNEGFYYKTRRLYL
jgi:DNA polymerase III alpha subunit